MAATSNPVFALLGGLAFAGCVLLTFSALDLPMDWKLSILLGGIAMWGMAVWLFDFSTWWRRRKTPPVLMQNMGWNFDQPAPNDLDGFITAVTDYQVDGDIWHPHQELAACGPVEVEFFQFHLEDDETLKVVTLHANDDTPWTQASLLHALHHELKRSASLGDSSFFEGLSPCGPSRFHLSLGS